MPKKSDKRQPPRRRLVIPEGYTLRDVNEGKISMRLEYVREPLGKLAALVYERLLELPEHEAMTGPAILDWLMTKSQIVSNDTLYDEIVPALRPYGLMNKPRIGYYIPPHKRPKNNYNNPAISPVSPPA